MKKKIALVINKLSDGGAERVVSNLSLGLYDKFDIDIIVNDSEHLEYPYKGHIISLNLPSEPKCLRTLYQIQVVNRRIRVLRYLKKKKKYAAVISFSDMCNVSNVLSGNRFGRTILTVHHSLLGKKDNSRIHQIITPVLMPWCFRKAYLTVSCSKGVNDELMREYRLPPEKGMVIYNGLELRTIRNMAKEPLDKHVKEKLLGKKIFVSVGRLIRSKGHRFLLNAVKILKDEGLPVHLIILGEGGQRASLEEQALKLGISDDISMPGVVMNPYAYMARADAVVMPSLYEGFGIAVVEALACGVPVISTDYVSGAREILAPDTDYRVKTTDRVEEAKYGILVPVCIEDEKDGYAGKLSKEEILMADAMRKILEDPALVRYYRKASLERAEQLDNRPVCEQWTGIIEE